MLDTSRAICSVWLDAMLVDAGQEHMTTKFDYNERLVLIFIANIKDVDCKIRYFTRYNHNHSGNVEMFETKSIKE